MADRLRNGLSKILGVTLRDIGSVQCGIVTFNIDGIDSETVKSALSTENINVSVSRPSSTLLDALRRGLPPLVRASVHYYNSEEEVDKLLKALNDIVWKGVKV